MIKPMLILAAAMIAAPAMAQDATADMAATTPAAAPSLPFCSAKVTDSCQQTKAQQARAMTGEQVDKRDAAGKWTPDTRATAAKKKK